MCVFPSFLSRVKPWRGLQFVIPLLPWKHAKPSADAHKIALEFVSNISHLPFCAWLRHASDGKWKTSAKCGKENYVIKDINTKQIFSAPPLHGHPSAHIKCTPSGTQHSDTPNSFVYMNVSVGLTRHAQDVLKWTANRMCLWNRWISLRIRFLNYEAQKQLSTWMLSCINLNANNLFSI